MVIAHLFETKNKTADVPSGLLEKYQKATKELIERLEAKGYKVLITSGSYKSRGVPIGIIVFSDKKISSADIKDDFCTVARDIKNEKNLGFKLWNFDLGEIYKGI